jgi:hypothetical protein
MKLVFEVLILLQELLHFRHRKKGIHNAHRFRLCYIKCKVISKYVRTAFFWAITTANG